MTYYRFWLIFLHPKIDALFFCTFLRIFKSEFLIQDLISRLTVKENGIFIYQNLSLGVDNQKQIKLKLNMSPLFNFFCSPDTVEIYIQKFTFKSYSINYVVRIVIPIVSGISVFQL